MAEPAKAAPKTAKRAASKAPAVRKAPAAAKPVAKAKSATTAKPNTTVKGVVDEARKTTSKLAGEAVGAARNAANEGKDKASAALTNVSKAVENAASLVEEKVGATYGGYARKAADQVSGIAKTLQDKDIDDLIEDTRTFIRKQPMIAIGAAAAIGFALTRLVKIGASNSDSDA